jgi:aldehyde dehydrogenase family 7 protein A1
MNIAKQAYRQVQRSVPKTLAFDTSLARVVRSPSNNAPIASFKPTTLEHYNKQVAATLGVRDSWATTPAPVRGQVIFRVGELLREHKDALAQLITLEVGKIHQESLGEVQEAIDICDFAVGLSRTLNGQVIPSERPNHVILERWNPLDHCVGIISAFNFPCAVFFWNAAISMTCGNVQVWKPGETVPLISHACSAIVKQALEEHGHSTDIAGFCPGLGVDVGAAMAEDRRISMLSFTGSTAVGKWVVEQTMKRMGKSILELGGCNAMIVDRSADIDMAVEAAFFSSVGTTGQRCTSLRRLYLHSDIHDTFLEKLSAMYDKVVVGDPFEKKTHCGPLHGDTSLFTKTVEEVRNAEDMEIVRGGSEIERDGNWVEPTMVTCSPESPLMYEERFIPVVYIAKVESTEDAVQYNNISAYGLSSSLFTQDLEQVFRWTGETGADSGIVNVNVGTSGAEIGGAFGGEKDTGGGRESGSDAWKQYMRRTTSTINFGKTSALAQGIEFDM